MNFPTFEDAVNVSQLQTAIAELIAARTKSGTEVLAADGANSRTKTVTFATPFASTPRVLAGIANGGGVANWGSRAISISPNGFTVYVFGPAASSGNAITVNWIATDLGNG